jgi:hypothetical protein
MNLERAGYHAVDAGFWVVLEIIIRWIRFRFNLIDLSSLVMFFPSSWIPIRLFKPYSVVLSRVKRVCGLCFK